MLRGWLQLMMGGVLLVMSGCPSRVPLYSPHMPDTENHQQAVKQKNCLECHHVGKLKYHKQDDECTKCHRIQRG